MSQNILNLTAKDFLSPGDPDGELVALLEGAVAPVGANLTDTLRTSHHLLARTLAEGKDPVAAAAACGMSLQRLRRLQDDPAFQELQSYYANQMADIFEGVQDRLAALGLTMLDVLQERVMDKPEKFSNRELADFANAFLERTIAPTKGPKVGASGPSPVAISIQFVRPDHAGPTLEATVVPTQNDPLRDLA